MEMHYEKPVDPRDRVVTLSADDLSAILEAIRLAAEVGCADEAVVTRAVRGRIDGIIEELGGKFDL